ncbi:MAG: hypothetical protein AVDCRST_MAG40-2271, partial [uncultured Gemmatimonadaceae bacterium]
GTAEKPVGTVWVAVDVNGAITARRPVMVGDRDEIRQRAAQAALETIRRALSGGPTPATVEAPDGIALPR